MRGHADLDGVHVTSRSGRRSLTSFPRVFQAGGGTDLIGQRTITWCRQFDSPEADDRT